MKQIIFKNTVLILISGMLFFSCKKDVEQPDLDTNTTSDNANSQSSFDDMAKVSEDALSGNGGAKMSAPGNPISCATVDIVVLATDSTKYTINFPGGTCSDGKVRSGTIIAVLDGATYNTPGATLTLTTSDYTINGNKVEGKKKITCVSNVSNNPVHDIVVSDTGAASAGFAKITYANSETATWKSKRTRTLVSGGGDADITNNIYDISATTGVGNPVAEGVNRNGKSYTVDIISPIRIDFSCFANNTARYPTQGVLKLTPDGKIARSIDYGDGTCDNKVQVIIGGKTYDITLAY
jgi:hypothetical protein